MAIFFTAFSENPKITKLPRTLREKSYLPAYNFYLIIIIIKVFYILDILFHCPQVALWRPYPNKLFYHNTCSCDIWPLRPFPPWAFFEKLADLPNLTAPIPFFNSLDNPFLFHPPRRAGRRWGWLHHPQRVPATLPPPGAFLDSRCWNYSNLLCVGSLFLYGDQGSSFFCLPIGIIINVDPCRHNATVVVVQSNLRSGNPSPATKQIRCNFGGSDPKHWLTENKEFMIFPPSNPC